MFQGRAFCISKGGGHQAGLHSLERAERQPADKNMEEDLLSFDENDEIDGHRPSCNFTIHDTRKILITMGSTASISVFMCVITITLVFVYRLHKHFTYRLASYQVLSAMCFSASLIVQISLINRNLNNDDTLCETLGFFVEYFMWVKLLFTVSLVIHFYVLAIHSKNLQKFEPIYILISVFVPFLYVWIPFIKSTYGKAGAWCWIKDWRKDCAKANDKTGVIEQFVLWYGPLYASLTASAIIAIYVGITLTRRAYSNKNHSETGPLLSNTIQRENTHNQAAVKQLIPLLAYPVIFYLLALVPVINRIYDAISMNVNVSLAIAHAISIGSWGFFSSWALLIHIAIKKKVRTKTSSFIADYRSNPSTFQTDAYESVSGSKLESSVSRSYDK